MEGRSEWAEAESEHCSQRQLKKINLTKGMAAVAALIYCHTPWGVEEGGW